ncbi:hypothetical protein BOTBODRAFT_334524 [Botryobasidium botryosum FD-172 SS1]|uniref:Uncharacterized protein n=1 Tax=Botryobasidium botryosum (strain FD-172 SS1) TaxID=930990 RepID=A0A067M180_BOTB1|nr:hypothetical protein BOTBODRAFT_334524 [Botryobasidium botryosum FD-172 SS1]
MSFRFHQNGHAVNTPPGFKVTNVPGIAYADTLMPQGTTMLSMEVSVMLDRVPKGDKRYMAMQEARYRIDRPNKPGFSSKTPCYGQAVPSPLSHR